MPRKVAKTWQSRVVEACDHALCHGRHAALIQLPTGLGKTLVAIRIFGRWRKRRPRMRLIIALQSATPRLATNWIGELKLHKAAAVTPAGRRMKVIGRVLSGEGVATPDGHIFFSTHRQLARAIADGKRSRSVVGKWLNAGDVMVVVDEVHRAGGLRTLIDKGWHGEARLPNYLRRRRGRTPGNRKWLLLSATPINPVKLDYSLDKPGQDIASNEERWRDEEPDRIADEVEMTYGLVAKLARQDRDREALLEFVDDLRTGLKEGRPPKCRLPIAVLPRDTAKLGPRRVHRDRVRLTRADLDRAVAQLLHVHRGLHALGKSAKVRVSTAERLTLGGARQQGGRLNGHRYVKGTVKAVSAARLPRSEVPVKLTAVAEIVSKLRNSGRKVVIFCGYRASATAVARYLRASLNLPRGEVFDASRTGRREEDRLKSFRNAGAAPFVLVSTDRLSESIDLHDEANSHVLVHFDLPWSPLRALQRFGRLWRIRGDGRRLPDSPQTFHVVHPGSVEEEVLHRLHRRWTYLPALGLGYLDIETAIGRRTPGVPW